MFKIASFALLALAGLSAIASSAHAQSAGQGNGGGNGGRGEYFSGVSAAPITHVRAPGKVILLRRGGAYCGTTWNALHDRNGKRNHIRHCDERRHIEID